MQIWSWGIRGAYLGFLIVGIILIMSILILLWIRKYRKVTREFSADDEWLTDERIKITHGQSTILKSGIATLRNLGPLKKGVTIILLCTLILSTSWFVWNLPLRYDSGDIENGDTRVFIVTSVDFETGLLSVRGIHDQFLDERSCKLFYFVQYEPEIFRPINVSLTWNLTCVLFAGVASSAQLRVSILLSDSDYDHIYLRDVYRRDVNSERIEIREHQASEVHIPWYCSPGSIYYVSIRLFVLLEGDSSIEGQIPGTSGNLVVNNISIEAVEPIE